MFRLFTAESLDRLRAVVVEQLPKIGAGIAVLIGLWLLAVVARNVIARVGLARRVEPPLARLMAKSAYLALLTVGVINGLGTAGVNVSAMIAGLGLTGFALGFALKDIISNLLAGVLVILYKTFREGDRIKVAGFEGRVREIDLRYTLLDADDETVFLPNQFLFNNAVVVSRPGPTSDVPV